MGAKIVLIFFAFGDQHHLTIPDYALEVRYEAQFASAEQRNRAFPE